MPAYVIVEIVVTDPVAYEEYKRKAAETVAAHGGVYIVRGGATETLEGDWRPSRIVVLRFESMEKAKAWWSSREYEGLKAIRRRSATTRMILVEGHEPPAE